MSVSTQQITPLRQEPAQVRPLVQRKKKTLLLNIPIATRLGIAFLLPALLAALALLRVGTLSQQLLSREASYYQILVGGDSSLRNANDTMVLLHTNLLGMVSDALKAQPLTETLIQDDAVVEMLSSRFNDNFRSYLQHDVLQRFPDLAALFTAAGHGNLAQEQAQLAAQLDIAWQRYLPAQDTSTSDILAGKYLSASYTEYLQVEPAYGTVMSALLQLRQFDDSLAPAIQDALAIEENSLLVAAAISALSILLGIGIVGYLVFSTVVRRLTRASRLIQTIEGGQIDARLTVRGRDEISDMCNAVNGMLDTIVGLLEETTQQRDELANAEELKRLHEELQCQHRALNEANARLAALATTDPLTGLANHRTVLSRIEEELSRCKRTQDSCALLFIDLDHFKHINDTYGHRAGDAVLCEVGRRLTATVRKEDFVGRYGGEEFAVLLVNTDQDEARQLGERLRVALAEAPIVWQADQANNTQAAISIQISGSIGVAAYDEELQTCAALVEAADGAMYHAKHSGRNRVCLAGEHSELLQEALEDGELTPDKAALQALLAAIQAFDRQTSLHAIRMMQLAESTAAVLGCSSSEQHLLRLAA
ncbi:MAG TPA: diguanylate cyclase, partial [Ktedonobacteraceae bacterium]|nr:diguanylate cyclase [Ktedonobacteraceae bacterium]